MIPYDTLPWQSFWKASARLPDEVAVDFDCGRKFTFAPHEKFATAGSCFSQHFGRHLALRGVNLLVAEDRHPLVPEDARHGYGVFSARYGNIYTARHLRELLEQALALRAPVHEFAIRPDGRWIDMLRPRAAPLGFASVEHAFADREFHLQAVRKMIEDLDVLVFTLGLTEAWENIAQRYCYPIVPGAMAGEYSPNLHRFVNHGYEDVVADLRRVIELIGEVNRGARVLLTVSPVGLAATAEPRNVMISTGASKSILRAAVDAVVREQTIADYFPSYEIITGSYARGRYWMEDGRDVTEQGVRTVMDVFVQSRLTLPDQPLQRTPGTDEYGRVQAMLDAECDEILLDPANRARPRPPGG